MTSEVNTLKTNDFQRRRKLRLQQVREQSKEIAKQIRERANIEKLRQVVEIDARKQQDYFQKQERLVKRLEEYYAKGIKHLGSGHKNANELNSQEEPDPVDLSKQRGKEATAELRKKRQEVLNKQKKILDRKLQAREAANELSREKSSNIINKIQSKPSSTTVDNSQNGKETDPINNGNQPDDNVKHNDMATQWDVDEIPQEWEPNIPTLSLPKDDNNSIKESNNVESKSDKSKRNDLFACSEEMPSSLRGGLTNEERVPTHIRPSLTLVSEYLQNRDLRLRETDSVTSKKKSEELHSLRQTIMKARVVKEGSSICHVHDGEMVPVPMWQAEKNYGFLDWQLNTNCSCSFKTSSNFQIRGRLKKKQDILPQYSFTPYGNTKFSMTTWKGGELKALKSSGSDVSAFQKKNPVTMYNHSTRDSRNIPHTENKNVVRNTLNEEDAYSQAVKETTSENKTEKEHNKLQEFRSKIAVTKNHVEKEYRDTISFLNSLPKDTSNKHIKYAFMDEQRKQMQKEGRQRKMQQEYKNIIKHCSKHPSGPKGPRKPKSPVKFNENFQYSWMPVPESDGNLAIHTIPISMKDEGNSAMITNVDNYHEYRSRHKHTPPTKDTSKHKQSSSDTESVVSESSIEKLTKKKNKLSMSDAEGIVIYKILDCKNDRNSQKKLVKEITKSLMGINKSNTETPPMESVSRNTGIGNRVMFEQVDEGVYKTVNQSGGDNITTLYCRDKNGEIVKGDDTKNTNRICFCGRPLKDGLLTSQSTSSSQWEGGDNKPSRNPDLCVCNKSECRSPSPHNLSKPQKQRLQPNNQPSTTTTASFTTASTDPAATSLPTTGLIKLIGDSGEETGKLFIGTSGLLKDDSYEVVIQLRKKGDEKKVEDKPEKVLKEDDLTRHPPTHEVPLSSEAIDKEVEKQNVGVQSKTDNEAQTISQEVNKQLSSDKQDIGIQNNTNSEGPITLIEETSKQSVKTKHSVSDTLVTQLVHKFLSEHYENLVPTSAHEMKNVAEKGVSTSNQNSVVLKQNGAQPVAASTCTQTSMTSPTSRPPYFHMSSSTSTAYMSPPDMIIPKFLKGKSAGDNNPKNYETDEINSSHDCHYDYHCDGNVMQMTTDDVINLIKYKNTASDDLRAPPNTDRSCDGDMGDVNYNKKEIMVVHTNLHKKKKHKCRKSETVKQRCSKRPSLPNKQISSTSTKDGKGSSKFNKSNLNPVVKDYVHKLLALNRESLKAIEVMDQDCSSVTTPGSSIIDIKNNKDIKTEESTISLEQIKKILKRQILNDYMSEIYQDTLNCVYPDTCIKKSKQAKCNKKSHRRQCHKVKSLNISKHLYRTKDCQTPTKMGDKMTSTSSSQTVNVKNPGLSSMKTTQKVRSSSSPTPRSEEQIQRKKSDKEVSNRFETPVPVFRPDVNVKPVNMNKGKRDIPYKVSSNSNCPSATSESETFHTSNMDSDINFVKLAESKLHNMEKIADLTEKCTKRLSNLAKVLEEVRKNKSLAYSQMSSSENTSDSDQKSDKNADKLSSNHLYSQAQKPTVSDTPEPHTVDKHKETDNTFDSTDYVTYLSEIPKATALNTIHLSDSSSSSSIKAASPRFITEPLEYNAKNRPKPPPALSRRHLKNGQELIVPHELSTVIEVDSPMSLKTKSQISRNDTKIELRDCNNSLEKIENKLIERNNSDNDVVNKSNGNHDLLESKADVTNNQTKVADLSDDSRMHMLELKQFNEIMLKPFSSIQEYAKRHNIEILEDASNLDDVGREEVINEEISSLHSDGSLPDVISELLKRNLITEPFKFDSGSNVNSTTISSESTFSALALSKAKKDKKTSNVMFKNKENIGETSDTLSLSSNPDLENAFKKLGMGWASSTLKKTKERLALSSSSNTSSSSLSQFKINSFNHENQVFVKDTASSVIISSKPLQKRSVSPRTVEQQTSLTNTMTVKEFLTKELAKKITFNNKSKNETEEEFVSLFETQMPDEMKQTSHGPRADNSLDNSASVRSGNRARTSTPVQLFKSMTYHSTSSSNLSNGLFSNADDLSSVKVTSNSMKHSTSDKDDLTIPNFSLKMKKGSSECSKSD